MLPPSAFTMQFGDTPLHKARQWGQAIVGDYLEGQGATLGRGIDGIRMFTVPSPQTFPPRTPTRAPLRLLNAGLTIHASGGDLWNVARPLAT